MSYPVYYPEEGDTLPILFDSFDGGTGASITLTGLAVTDIEIYKDGSVTQRSSDAGYTLLDTDGIDFDGVTGIHGFSIDLSDNTDASFYAVGSWYHVVVSSVTIDAQTVNFIAAAFRIVSATRGLAGTALPNAAADGVGGLPISDAGGLDLDNRMPAAAAITNLNTVFNTDFADAYNATDNHWHADLQQVKGSGTAAQNLATVFDTDFATNYDATNDKWAVRADLQTIKGQTVTCAAGVTIYAHVGTAAADTAQTGDSYAIVSSGTYGNSALKTILDTKASQTSVDAVQNNTRVVRVVPTVIERPDSGTVTYRIEVLLYDAVGNMEAPDSAPTVDLVDQGGTDLSSRLDSATGTLVSTGRYRWIYTASSTDDLEQLVWAFSVIEGGATRLYGNTTLIVDTTAVDFTSSDRSKLETIYGKMPSRDYIAGSTAATGAFVTADIGLATANLDTQLDGLSTEIGDVETKVDAVATDVTTLLGRITSTLFSGITYLSRWLGALAGKTADTTTRAEINATTAGANYNETTDSGEAIRDRGDAAWTTGGGGGGDATAANQTLILTALSELQGAGFVTSTDSNKALSDAIAGLSLGAAPQLLLSTTIATVTSQTVLVLTAGSADNNAYDGMSLAIIVDQATATQKTVAAIASYVGGTLTLTLATTPRFTVAAGDSIYIIAIGQSDIGSVNGLPVDTGQINVTVVNTSTVQNGTLVLYRGADYSIANNNPIHFTDVENIDSADNLYLTIVNNETEAAVLTRKVAAAFSEMNETADFAATALELTVDSSASYAFVVERKVGSEYNPILWGPCTIKDNNRTFPT
jgi:hypothetical protein